MTTQKVLTAKKLLSCVIIDKNNTGVTWAVIQRTDGTFGFHDHTNFISREEIEKDPAPYYGGMLRHEFLNKFDFDEKPFIDAFEKFLLDKEKAKTEREKAAREAEEKRIQELKAEIKECQTPKELADRFKLSVVELASHWSDLYEGRSTIGILISDAKENEILELAKDIHDIDGCFGEARRRDGEHHSTFSEVYDLASYQEGCKKHFNGNNYFYKSQESEKEFYLEQVKECEDIEEVQALIKSYEELEAGYYDCNGNLEIEEEKLESADFTGYYEDVYSYSFCFKFWQGNKWKEEEDEENETAGN
jgi:hypothetical protein